MRVAARAKVQRQDATSLTWPRANRFVMLPPGKSSRGVRDLAGVSQRFPGRGYLALCIMALPFSLSHAVARGAQYFFQSRIKKKQRLGGEVGPGLFCSLLQPSNALLC